MVAIERARRASPTINAACDFPTQRSSTSQLECYALVMTSRADSDHDFVEADERVITLIVQFSRPVPMKSRSLGRCIILCPLFRKNAERKQGVTSILAVDVCRNPRHLNVVKPECNEQDLRIRQAPDDVRSGCEK